MPGRKAASDTVAEDLIVQRLRRLWLDAMAVLLWRHRLQAAKPPRFAYQL
jgi:hypothetical protein